MPEPANTDVKVSDDRVNVQLRFFQATSLVLFLLLLVGGAYYEIRQHMTVPVEILVDGKPVTTVESIADASQIVRSVREKQTGPEYVAGDNPHFTEDVEFKRTDSTAPIDSDDAAETKLSASAHTVVQADAIVVDGKPIVALPDATTAQAAVDALRDHYVAMPPVAPLADKPTFLQTVTIDRRLVPAYLTKRTADDAAKLLWTPSTPKTYTVQLHQTGWLISRKFHMTFGDFLRANAGTDVNRLAPGDFVVVSKTFPPVDVVVKKMTQENQTFGGTGVRQVTLESTYIDGEPSGTPIATNITMIQRATPRRVVD